MSTLLQKPFKAFATYALLVLVCSIPVYYWVVDAIWLEELDEHNAIIAQRITREIGDSTTSAAELDQRINLWRQLLSGLDLQRVGGLKPDSVYSTSILEMDEEHEETEHYRVLATYFTIKGQPHRLTIQSNIEEADETLAAIAGITVLFFVLLVVGFMYLNKRISKKIWQPFWVTLERLKDFDLKNQQGITFSSTDIKEFEELNQTLTKLIDRNIAAYGQQKAFLENASHELQTPLAVLKAKLDVLMQSPNQTKEQGEIMEAIAKSLARVSRLNKNLLVLAKIENEQFGELEKIELVQLLDETVELFADLFPDYRIAYRTPDEPQAPLVCNMVLAETLVNNLVMNAVRHSEKGSTITIDFSANKLVVSNPGIEALSTEKLFKRFAVTSTQVSSSGLGLAIVKEICNRYGWQVSYQFSNGQHQFIVDF